jgi:hypothetical protein
MITSSLIFRKQMDIAASNFMVVGFSRCPSSPQNLRKKKKQPIPPLPDAKLQLQKQHP